MEIKSIRLQNFKGFRDATLKLKPLTVILGPNSAGKSCFGQALVALSKSNAEKDVPSLAFEESSSVEFGSYSDLIHTGCEGQLVAIQLELSSSLVNLGFGPVNIKAGIKDLDIRKMEIWEHAQLTLGSKQPSPESVSQTIKMPYLDVTQTLFKKVEELTRGTNREWNVINDTSYDADLKINKSHSQNVNVKFHGITIDTVSHLTGTGVNINEVAPKSKLRFDYLASLLRGVSYLRPDREPPRRKRTISKNAVPTIDDRGDGTDWYIHENKQLKVDTFYFPDPSTDKEQNKSILSEYFESEPQEKYLPDALSIWLDKLGLASSMDIRLIDDDRSIQAVATPKGQHSPKPLTDLGFGVSQVLPILVKGLTIKKEDILVVEQPEAQLHPKPQAGLADFFCAMVKCGRNVIVETHSVELFHRLRLRASMDDELAEKIAVYFLHEPQDGACCEPILVPLIEEDELDWPKGFLPEGMEKEMEILATRLARMESSS